MKVSLLAISLATVSAPCWPAAGLALAAALTFGSRVLPYLVFGYFVGELDWAHPLQLAAIDAGTLLVQAIGAGIQAWFAASILRRLFGSHPNLDTTKSVLLTLLVAGPVSCLISATIGVPLLIFRGFISPLDWTFSWLTWFLGDTNGVYVGLPVSLFIFGRPRDIWSRRSMLGWPVAALTLSLSLLIGTFSAEQRSRMTAQIENTASDLARDWEAEIVASIVSPLSLCVDDRSDGATECGRSNGFQLNDADRRPLSLAQLRDAFGVDLRAVEVDAVQAGGFSPYWRLLGQSSNTTSLDLWLWRNTCDSAARLTSCTQVARLPLHEMRDVPGFVNSVEGLRWTMVLNPVESDGHYSHLVQVAGNKDLTQDADVAAMLGSRTVLGVEATVRIDLTAELVQAVRPVSLWLLPVVAGLLSGMVAAFALLGTGHTARTELDVVERTSDLQRLNEKLHRNNADLARLHRRMLASHQKLETLAHGLSHDLKSPIRAVAGLARWIDEELEAATLEDSTREAIDDYLRRIYTRVERASRLLDDAFEYTRALHISGTPRTVKMAEVLARVQANCLPEEGFSFTVFGAEIELETVVPVLERVLGYIVQNSVQFRRVPEGTISCSCTISGSFVDIEISDDGQGIPPEYMAKVFLPFCTLAPRDRAEHSGMGLAIARAYVEGVGGEISIVPRPPPGTTVKIHWPATWSVVSVEDEVASSEIHAASTGEAA